MDPDLLHRRQQLVDRHDALAPEGGRPGDASAALAEVARGLEAVAREAEDRGDRSVEVGRTWRWAGMAWHDAAVDRDETTVRRALAAYEQSERLIDGTADVVDAIKTDYCTGRALLNLADGADGSLAGQAVDRLVRARAGARRVAPHLLPSIEAALASAEQVAALRARAGELDSRIESLTSQITGPAEQVHGDAPAEETKALFGILQQQFVREEGSMDPERRQSLNDVMESLAGLVGKAGTDRTLGDMAVDRARLDALMQRMHPLLRRDGDGDGDGDE